MGSWTCRRGGVRNDHTRFRVAIRTKGSPHLVGLRGNQVKGEMEHAAHSSDHILN